MYFFFLIFGCNKDKFPKEDEILGHWVEETDHAFKTKLFFYQDTLLIEYEFGDNKYTYILDESKSKLNITAENTNLSRDMDMFYNKKNEKLKVWEIYSVFPSGFSGESVFIKE